MTDVVESCKIFSKVGEKVTPFLCSVQHQSLLRRDPLGLAPRQTRQPVTGDILLSGRGGLEVEYLTMFKHS